jgi:hypothetical protein
MNRRHIPLLVTAAYVLIYATVLIKNTIWSVGDQTDVIRAGIAAFPLGLILSFGYPGGRTGAFVAVSVCAAINAVVIFFLTRSFVPSVDKRVPSESDE